MTVILLIFAYQKNVLTSVSVRLYSYSLLVPESGSSRLLHAQRYLGRYCSIFLQIVYLSQATLLQIFTFFCVTNGDKKRRKSCNINIE